MSKGWKIQNPDGMYFITFAVIEWVDVFSRKLYKDEFIKSLEYCQEHKGLELFAWCIMTNHVHLVARAKEGFHLSDILRDLKKYTSSRILKMIEANQKESRRNWMLWLFKSAGQKNSNNKHYQFWRQDNHPIELLSMEIVYQKINYIHMNPVLEGVVDQPEYYLYSSARDYAGRRGLLELAY
ncbi:MAG: transposase [Chitinophagaceae bacterium]|nr:transposase [Chitinophagaceae bacterium]